MMTPSMSAAATRDHQPESWCPVCAAGLNGEDPAKAPGGGGDE